MHACRSTLEDPTRALATLEERAGRWDAAALAWRRLLPLEDGEVLVETALRLATACDKADRIGDARGGLERALRVAPRHEELRRWLRTVYNVTGASRELAALVLEDAAAAGDVAGRFGHLMIAGRLLVESDASADRERAVTVFEEARSLRPEEHEATLLLADALASCGRRADGLALLAQAIAAHRGRRSRALAAAYQRVAKLHLAEGDLTDALTALSKAYDADPHNGSVAMELGLFAADIDDTDVAARAFRSVTLMKTVGAGSADAGATAGQKGLAYYHLARIAETQGDRRKARLMVERAVVEDPTLDEARSLLEQLRA